MPKADYIFPPPKPSKRLAIVLTCVMAVPSFVLGRAMAPQARLPVAYMSESTARCLFVKFGTATFPCPEEIPAEYVLEWVP